MIACFSIAFSAYVDDANYHVAVQSLAHMGQSSKLIW